MTLVRDRQQRTFIPLITIDKRERSLQVVHRRTATVFAAQNCPIELKRLSSAWLMTTGRRAAVDQDWLHFAGEELERPIGQIGYDRPGFLRRSRG